MKQDPRPYFRPGSLVWQIASLDVGDVLLVPVGDEGIQARQSNNTGSITRLRKIPGCEARRFNQCAFYAVAPDSEEMIKLVRITRLPDGEHEQRKSTP